MKRKCRTTTIDPHEIRVVASVPGSGRESFLELLRYDDAEVVQKVRIVVDSNMVREIRDKTEELCASWRGDIAWALNEGGPK